MNSVEELAKEWATLKDNQEGDAKAWAITKNEETDIIEICVAVEDVRSEMIQIAFEMNHKDGVDEIGVLKLAELMTDWSKRLTPIKEISHPMFFIANHMRKYRTLTREQTIEGRDWLIRMGNIIALWVKNHNE